MNSLGENVTWIQCAVFQNYCQRTSLLLCAPVIFLFSSQEAWSKFEKIIQILTDLQTLIVTWKLGPTRKNFKQLLPGCFSKTMYGRHIPPIKVMALITHQLQRWLQNTVNQSVFHLIITENMISDYL